jgi:hypothetical protein
MEKAATDRERDNSSGKGVRPLPREAAPVPLFCAETFAHIAAEHKWVIAVYLITIFIVLPPWSSSW